MDLLVILFFLLVSTIFSILGYVFKEPGLGGMGALGFIITGFSFMLVGVDIQTSYQQTSNFTARDDYAYSWNNTYNVSRLDNVTTAFNKTLTQGFQYYSQINDQWTRFIAILTIFGGLLVANGAFTAWQRGRKPAEESV
jgi:hypothetical protein